MLKFKGQDGKITMNPLNIKYIFKVYYTDFNISVLHPDESLSTSYFGKLYLPVLAQHEKHELDVNITLK